ncbi:MAG TPA: hypothetical protein VES59_06705 [Bacteroidota bacterium]|nr:hypothetical protein [Bacteroidota bacterium]
MGQQQLLLVILGLLVVAIAIAVGITFFGANSSESNKDGITAELTGIAADAYQYKIRPTSLGGGRPDYTGYSLPAKMQKDDNGTYVISSISSSQAVFTGTSSMNTSWVATMTADDSGHTMVTYAGW